MNFKLVSWNVRGLNNLEKRRLVNSMIWGWKADIICLQETKLEGNVIDLAKQVWGGKMDQTSISGIQWDKRGDLDDVG